ncbi:MAG: hemolysin family protein [Acidimicrobiales bacterium]
MDGSLWWQLALVGVLIVINAAFAGAEIALVSLREHQLQRLADQSETGRVLARLARDPNRFLATIQVGITLAGFLASATAAVALAEPLVGALSFLGGAAEPVAIVLVTLVLTFVTLVVGELAPKRVAMQRSERWAMIAARPLAGLARAARPVVWLLGRSTDAAVRLMGGDPTRHRDEVTEEELRDLLVSKRSFTPEQRAIISGVFEIADRSLRMVLVPRRDVVAIRADQPVAEGLDVLVATGHSRAPVVEDDLDAVVGIVHWRDLVRPARDEPVAGVVRPATVLPETVGVIDALRQLQADREQIAVVVNEYGGTEGIVTIEDLIEELVGEIYDESDPDVLAVEWAPDGTVLLDGGFPVHDLSDLGIELPEGDYATVAGLLLDRLGHIPERPGARVRIDGWQLEVAEVDGRAISRVRVRRVP